MGGINFEFWWGVLIFDYQAPTISLRGPAEKALKARRANERAARVHSSQIQVNLIRNYFSEGYVLETLYS